MRKIKTIYTYWKIPVAILFVGLICLAVHMHSGHWISVVKGILFFSDLSDDQQLAWIRETCCYTVPVLSVLFFVIRNRISHIVLITLMIIHVLLVFPFGYVEDPTESF